jgi:integrase
MSGVRLAEMLFERQSTRRNMAVRTGVQTHQHGEVRMTINARRAAKVAREQRRALIAAAACHVNAEAWNASGISTKAIMPAVKVLRTACKGSRKCGWSRMSRARQRAVYVDRSEKTIMERADGFMPAIVVRGKDNQSGILSVESGAAMFQEEVLTSALQGKTRARYHALWRGFVTYGLAQRDLEAIMPATKEMVQAWALQLMMLGASPALIRSSIAAVQSRHSEYGFPAPLNEAGAFKRFMKAVLSLQGSPRRQITPITRKMMTKLMLLRELTPGQERDVLITVTGTQLGARVGELKRLQVCDLLVDHDVPYSRRFRGSAAVRIRKRKQDQLRRGLYPRLAKGSTARLCVVRRLQRMMATRSLQVSDACTKAVRPAARCPHCPPLFASFRRSGGSYLPLSRQQISGAVKRAINLVQSDSGSFSGISMRRGCISQAIHARVPEPILYLQSGHGSGFAARTYIVPEDPRVLHETAQALRL